MPLRKDCRLLNSLVQCWRGRLTDRRLHEFLWYCVPGVLIGLILRAWLTASLPYGYYHPDTHDFLVTPYEMFQWHLRIHSKTTFLTPLLYTVPFLLKVPALLLIPLGQHARGLLLVLMAGALCRLWSARWRWWIIPLTALVAAQPAMMFWEHTLMSESGFVFCAAWVALAGSLFARWPDWEKFIFLLFAMCAVAGARPEGALLTGSGALLTVLVCWGQWRAQAGKLAAAFALWAVMVATMQTSHSGLLLYSSLVHLTPDAPRAVPGFGPYVQPLRDEMARRRAEKVSNDVVRTSKRIAKALQAYATDHPNETLGLPIRKRGEGNALERALSSGPNMSLVCRKLARESALAHLSALPGVAIHKFLMPINQDSGGRLEEYELHDKQAFTLAGNANIARMLGRGLTGGEPLDTPEQAEAFVQAHYNIARVAWFNQFSDGWRRALNAWRLPSTRYSDAYQLPGMPILYLLSIFGALASMLRPSRVRRFHLAFVPALFGMWFVVALAAAVIPRHRFVLEPFWLLYLFAFLDSIVWLIVLAVKRLQKQPPESTLTQVSAGV